MSGGWRMAKRVGEMALNRGGGAINWFPGHMAAATRAIRERLKLADLVVEVRDARIPLSSVNEDLQSVLSHKRRVIALNKKDLANPNIMNRCLVQWEPRDLTENYYPHRNVVTLLPLLQAARMPGICLTASALAELKWVQNFDSWKQDCLSINAHRKNSVTKLLALVELKLKEVILRQPTLLVMVVGVPNVGKSTLINSIHQIAAARFPVQEKMKRATVGPSPGVTQDIAGYKIAHEPSIYVLDTPGILVPSIPDIETGLKLALTGAVKDSVVGEERLAQYLLAVLNTRSTPLHWKHLDNKHEEIPRDSLPRKGDTDARYIEDLVAEVRRALFTTFEEFEGDLEDDNCLESLIENQFLALQKAFRISSKSSEARCMVSKKLLALFRIGKLGPFTLDVVPSTSNP